MSWGQIHDHDIPPSPAPDQGHRDLLLLLLAATELVLARVCFRQAALAGAVSAHRRIPRCYLAVFH
jgi:hypothetical protein